MKKFPISSESIELLIAFKESESLQDLADTCAKDISVVSRRLQRMASESPVIEKIKGRYQVTAFGESVIKASIQFLKTMNDLGGGLEFEQASADEARPLFATKNPALLVVNAQKGLHSPEQAKRNNLTAEDNIQKLLERYRELQLPVFHIKHLSENPQSFFYKESEGAEFMDSLGPIENEYIVEKSTASAFIDTPLKELLREKEIEEVVLVGFTANECIDATARQASDLSFLTYVIRDASAMFDFRNREGQLQKADRIHQLTMTNLDALFARVLDTDEIEQGLKSL